MLSTWDLELAKTARIIINDLLEVAKGENVLITVDSLSDFRAAEECAKAAYAAGGKVHLAYHSPAAAYGKAGEHAVPSSVLAGIPETDVWIEFNQIWLMYSSAFDATMRKNKTRYLMLSGMDTGSVVRCIGQLDMQAQAAFQNELTQQTRNAKTFRTTTPAGTDLRFENDPNRAYLNELKADTVGSHFLTGNISWAPIEASIEGTIVFDGIFSAGGVGEAELGLLQNTIQFEVKEGLIQPESFTGGDEANIVKNWLASFNDPNMYQLAHASYGINPGAQLISLVCEGERVWGCTEFGFGNQNEAFLGKRPHAISHCDGTCMNASVWFDDKKVLEDGRFIEPTLLKLAQACGRANG